MDSLTSNAVTRVNGMQSSDDDLSFQPTLQIINIRKVNKNSSTQDRYRVSQLIDRNKHCCWCILPSSVSCWHQLFVIAHSSLFVATATTTTTIQIVLSDGVKYIQGLLATQLNTYVQEQGLQENSIIRLEKFVKNLVSGRNLVVTLKLEAVSYTHLTLPTICSV